MRCAAAFFSFGKKTWEKRKKRLGMRCAAAFLGKPDSSPWLEWAHFAFGKIGKAGEKPGKEVIGYALCGIVFGW